MDRRTFVRNSAIAAAMGASAGIAPAAMAAEGSSSQDGKASGSALADGAEQGNPSWLGEEPEVASSDIVRTETTTLLIVGAGTSGLACAATACDMGLDFVLAEKLSTIPESREYFGAVNSTLQQQAGITIDKGKLLNELSRYASGKCDRDVIRIWIEESAECVDWFTPMLNAAGQSLILPDYASEQAGGTDYYSPVIEHMTGTFYIPPVRNEVILQHIQNSGHDVSYDYELVRLVHGDGGVTGAIFDTDDGYVQVDAKYVVLACGGYAANPDMMMALQPGTCSCITTDSYNPSCSGDGIKAGLWAGAIKEPFAAPMLFDRGVVDNGVDAGYVKGANGKYALPGETFQLNIGSQPFLKVNRRGKRFANESTPYDNICFAAGRQPGGVFCQVFDGNAKDDIIRFMQTGCAAVTRLFMESGGDIDSYLETVECTLFKKADTLDELADKLGFEGDDKEAFLATCDRYNELYDAQEDSDYGKEAYRLSELRTPPFYGCWFGASLLTTLDGLRINSNLQVLDAGLEPIPGLYAIGDCSGSFFADNYPEYLVGSAAGRSTTEGRHLAKQLAKAEGIDVEAADTAAKEALAAAVTEVPEPGDYVANGAKVVW